MTTSELLEGAEYHVSCHAVLCVVHANISLDRPRGGHYPRIMYFSRQNQYIRLE
jgi:hypothetical protein